MYRNDKETILVRRIGFFSFLVNILLIVLKGGLFYISGSLAILTSALDSATDSVASLAMWVGLRLSTRKNRKFPYGLYKLENVIQVFLALLIFYIGWEITHQIWIADTEPPEVSIMVISGMAAGVLIPLLFGWFEIITGRRTGSPALTADGKHRQADVLSSAVVLIAVTAHYFQLRLNYYSFTIDRIAASLVLIFL